MPVTLQGIKEHHDYYGIADICTIHTTDYQQLIVSSWMRLSSICRNAGKGCQKHLMY